METKKQKALAAVGWKFGDAEDFLEMSADERQLLETRMNIAAAIKRQREAGALSQKNLGHE